MTVVIGLKGLAFCICLAQTVCNGFPCGILYQVWYLIVSFSDLSWSLLSFLNTCHTRWRFHCVATVRTQENHDIFCENCLSQRPYSDQGVATELSWRSITFLRCSWWRFSAISRCFHCASTVHTAHTSRFHGVATATPVTPGGVSTALPPWERKKIMILFVKNCLSRRPYRDQGGATELSLRSIAFLRCSWWRFSAISRRFHCAFTAHSRRSQRMRRAFTALPLPHLSHQAAFPLCCHRENATKSWYFL